MQEVIYTLKLLPEDMPIEGSFASGDDGEDKALEAQIYQRLEHSQWAWCVVKVTAKFKGFEGSAYLGGCSYFGTDAECERDFRTSGYYDDMCKEALAHLKEALAAEAQRGARAAKALSILRGEP